MHPAALMRISGFEIFYIKVLVQHFYYHFMLEAPKDINFRHRIFWSDSAYNN